MSARRDAVFALSLWKTQGTFPTQALANSEDHAFALELVGAVLRHKSSLEWILKRCMKRLPDGDLWATLMIGAAQLLVLPKVAEHAAVSETVEVAKPIGKDAAKFVNAVLRRIQREKEALLAALHQQPDHLQLDVPKALWERWMVAYGDAATHALGHVLSVPPRVCIRPLPPHAHPLMCEPHPEDPLGTFIVPHGVRIESLPGYAEGAFVVQDVSTRHAIQLLDVQPGQRVLDACAAPGGKTAQIAARLTEGELVANEPNPRRILKLTDTLQCCGVLERVKVTQEDAITADWGLFDRILLDVPCSNTGVLARRPDARWSWTPTKLIALIETQAALLDAAAQHLAPNGKLVYSTCSIEPEENAFQIKAFLQHHPDFTLTDTRQELPTELHDGAFAALLQRK